MSIVLHILNLNDYRALEDIRKFMERQQSLSLWRRFRARGDCSEALISFKSRLEYLLHTFNVSNYL